MSRASGTQSQLPGTFPERLGEWRELTRPARLVVRFSCKLLRLASTQPLQSGRMADALPLPEFALEALRGLR